MSIKTQKATVAAIGEEIGIELGTTLVSAYQTANPADVHYYVIGRNILDQLLAQPNCSGIRFYNAYDENGVKTLVYVGVDAAGNSILEITSVNQLGELESKPAIVADRTDRGQGGGRTDGGVFDADNWNWEIE